MLLRVAVGLVVLTVIGGAVPLVLGAAETVVSLPITPLKVSHTLEIDRFRSDLSLDATISSQIEFQPSTVRMTTIIREPRLYDKLISALSSQSGCKRIFRRAGVETQWCRIEAVSVSFDPRTSRGRLRAKARMRKILGPVTDTKTHDVSFEFEARVVDANLRMNAVSLNISDIPGELDSLIVDSMGGASIPLHECLRGANYRLEQVSLPQGADEFTLVTSTSVSDAVRTLACVRARS